MENGLNVDIDIGCDGKEIRKKFDNVDIPHMEIKFID
jgi:hypothetical protein